MIGRRISGSNVRFGPPEGWNEATQGSCADLFVKVTKQIGGEVYCESAWEPTPEELAALVAGGSVILRVVGNQPPVALWVDFAPIGDAG